MTDPRSTRRMRELNKQVIDRDKVCVVCGTDEGLQVDHIIPYAVDPSLVYDIDNLQAMCATHNRDKSDKMNRKRVTWFNPKLKSHPSWKK